jgi:hypothetical protein
VQATYRRPDLRPRVIVHNNLLDLEQRVFLRRSSSPSLVAVSKGFVSIASVTEQHFARGFGLTTSYSTSSVHLWQSARSS